MAYYGGSGSSGSSGRPSSEYAPYPSAAQPHSPATSSGAATPTSTSAGSSSFLSSSFYNAFGGIMRRLSSDPAGNLQPHHTSSAPPQQHGSTGALDGSSYTDHGRAVGHAATFAAPGSSHLHLLHRPASASFGGSNGIDGVYTPPMARTASPLRPPPLEPLTLSGFSPDTPQSARLLTSAIAEEIRIMVPERLRIEEDWKLVYSLDQDGASLATLYEKTSRYDEHRIGFVLVVKDQEGGIFGAYLSEYPRPSAHYFGTGECFLWRASLLAPLPPPPSANTAHLTARSTTIAASPTLPTWDGASAGAPATAATAAPAAPADPAAYPEPLLPGLATPASSTASFVSTADDVHPPPSPSIRFSAFPYSGINEYFIYCEPHSLSVGGGDGRYGLWLNDSLEKGISATCMTFGNQPLSDEGDKFGVLGVEVWVIGSRR